MGMNLMSVVGAILLAAAGILIADDCKAWSPRLASRLLHRAVRRLAPDQRQRYQEEWEAHLNDIPGVIGKLVFALSLQRASRMMADGRWEMLSREREMLTAALRREKEFSEFLLKSSTEGIVVFDREFRITLWNPGMERVTGMTVDCILGQRIFDVLPYLVGTIGEAAIRTTLDGRETSLYDQRYPIAESRRDGIYDSFFSPLYSRGYLVGGIGFMRERMVGSAVRASLGHNP
jgi:PAS domain S-box-containing protein